MSTFFHRLQKKRLFIATFILGILFFGFTAFVDVMSNKPAIRAYCAQTQEFISLNQPHLEYIFSSVFTQAQNCNGDPLCETQIRQEIFSSLQGKDIPYFESTYFIRLQQDMKIEKMFFSGRYSTVATENEKPKQVQRVLLGKRGPICDDGWKIDGNEMEVGFSGSRMRYLYDFFSEAEIVIPVKKDGQVIGAIVRVWGD